jgi:hypothetical protein
MSVDSLKDLKDLEVVFRDWRNKKRYEGEKIPETLVNRAREAATVHGVSAVMKATGLWRRRIVGKESKPKHLGKVTPTFSRIAVTSPIGVPQSPLVEVETANGLKIRVFGTTPETMALLTSLCRPGGHS